MTATLVIDWANETAVADWGHGCYRLRCHRYPGARPVYEYETPAGAIVRVGGFRTGVRDLYALMMRECESPGANAVQGER